MAYFRGMSFSERLRERMDKVGISQHQLAIKTKGTVSVATINAYLNNESEPNITRLNAIAEALETTGAYLLEETDDPLGPKRAPQVDTSEFEGVLSKEKIESILGSRFSLPFVDIERAASMTDEQLARSLQETKERIILYKLRDELEKELERRKRS